MRIDEIVGVDFSGARLAGRNIWLAWVQPSKQRLRLKRLARLETVAGSAEREHSLQHLVELITTSRQTLWGIDFPFGLPVELWSDDFKWRQQLEHIAGCELDAPAFGRWCVENALRLGDRLHIRRRTDSETKTPFDCYHYRIIYQTFHGMRDVLRPLLEHPSTAIVPFTSVTDATRRIVVESCPGSTLKRLNLPHQNYKQPAGGPLTAKRLRVRRTLLEGLSNWIDISDADRRTIQRNPGGDALDAVIAAIGVWQGWHLADHAAILAHDRYPREGRVYC